VFRGQVSWSIFGSSGIVVHVYLSSIVVHVYLSSIVVHVYLSSWGELEQALQ